MYKYLNKGSATSAPDLHANSCELGKFVSLFCSSKPCWREAVRGRALEMLTFNHFRPVFLRFLDFFNRTLSESPCKTRGDSQPLRQKTRTLTRTIISRALSSYPSELQELRQIPAKFASTKIFEIRTLTLHIALDGGSIWLIAFGVVCA